MVTSGIENKSTLKLFFLVTWTYLPGNLRLAQRSPCEPVGRVILAEMPSLSRREFHGKPLPENNIP